MSDPQARVRADIAEFGWHCIKVQPTPDEDLEPFAYTIGLVESYEHPEIAVFGLPGETAHQILHEAVRLVQSGSRIELDTPVSEILSGDYTVIFKPVQTKHIGEYLGHAVRHYGGSDFGALVMFWPDREHRFPWQPGCLVGQKEALSIAGLAV